MLEVGEWGERPRAAVRRLVCLPRAVSPSWQCKSFPIQRHPQSGELRVWALVEEVAARGQGRREAVHWKLAWS